MIDFLKEMFKEQSSVSNTRVLTTLVVSVALGIAIYSVSVGKDSNQLVALLLGVAFTGKVVQKFAEK